MASLEYTTLDVFTDQKFAGNPLAVVHVAPGVTLSQSQKQTIAREFNYSETTFLHPSTDGEVPEWQLDIFTTTSELPFAGHPTIGTACHILGKTGKSKGRFKVKAGTIELDYNNGVAKAAIPHNTHIHSSHDLTSSRVLKWQPDLTRHYPSNDLKVNIVSPVKGMNFAMIELRDLEELALLTLPGAPLQYTLDQDWDVGPRFCMFFVRLPNQSDGIRRVRTRMIEGAFEDPATGSASCGLAAFLALQEGVKDGKVSFEMTQAVEMGRKSDIGVDIEFKNGEIDTVVLSGKSVTVMEGKVFYE